MSEGPAYRWVPPPTGAFQSALGSLVLGAVGGAEFEYLEVAVGVEAEHSSAIGSVARWPRV